MREQDIQSAIRVHVSKHKLGTLFRANVGTGWQGKVVRRGDSFLLDNPRPFSTGLPEGFPDLFGFTPVVITEEMVGQVLPVFCGLEVKSKKGRVRPAQETMLAFLQNANCRAGIVRSVDDAEALLRGRI